MIESTDTAVQPVQRAEVAKVSNLWRRQTDGAPASLRIGFSWLIVGNLVFAICQWGNLAVLAKLSSPAAVGRFALALAVAAPVFMLTNLQLRSIQATDVRRQFLFPSYSALRLASSAGGVVIVLAVSVLLGYSAAVIAVVMAVAVGRFADSLNDLTFGLAQFHEQFNCVAIGRMLAGVASLLGMSLGIWLGRDVLWGAIGWATGHAATALLTPIWLGRNVLQRETHGRASASPEDSDPAHQQRSAVADPSHPVVRLSAWKTLSPDWNARSMLQLARLALPMGIVMMLVSTNINMPRYFVEQQLGEGQLGVYSAMAYCLVAGHMFVLALGQAAIPRLAKQFAKGDLPAFQGLLWRLLALGAGCAGLGLLLAVFCGPQVMSVLYTPEYGAYPEVLICLALVAAIDFACIFLGEAMTAAREFRPQVPLFVTVLAATALGCSVLIPKWGLLGAALATGCGGLVQLVGSTIILSFATRRQRRVTA